MYTMNQLTIIGFTGNDAEAHYTTNGTLVTTLSVATKELWKDGSDQWQSHREWHRVATSGKLAEYARTLGKGSHVMVQGAVRTREYERDGVKHRLFACSNFAPTRSPSWTGPSAGTKTTSSRKLAKADAAAGPVRQGWPPHFALSQLLSTLVVNALPVPLRSPVIDCLTVHTKLAKGFVV